MRKRLVSLCIPALALAVSCHADVFAFEDGTESISLTLNGSLVTGNGGRISNFTATGEFIGFDLTLPAGIGFATVSGFTNMLNPVGSDDPAGTVSDRFVYVFVNGSPTYHVAFGSDPDLPAIPNGAIDLTTISVQGLPNPLYEDGSSQLVATAFLVNFNDTFYARSDGPSPVPEPSSVVLLLTVMAMTLVAVHRKASGRSGRPVADRA